MRFTNANIRKPESGSLVIVRTKKESCGCSGYEEREVYFDTYFHGIKNQGWIKAWVYSPNNDILSQLEKENKVPEPCKNCVE